MSLRPRRIILILCSISSPLFAQGPRSLASVEHQADSLLFAGDVRTGEQLVRTLLRHRRDPGGTDDSLSTYAEYMLGVFTLEQANYAAAEDALEQAISSGARVYSAHDPIVASAWSRLARLYAEQSRYSDAVRASNEQVSIYRLEFGADNKFTALASLTLAEYALEGGDVAQADNVASSLSATIMSGFGNTSVESIRLQRLVGDIAFAKRRYADADRIYSAALNLLSSEHEARLELRARLELARARTRTIISDPDSAEHDVRRAERDVARLNPASYALPVLCKMVSATVDELQSRPAAAFSAFDEGLGIYKAAAETNFSYTSERERLEFLRDVHRTSGRVFSCAVRTNTIYPQGARSAYDWLLFEKGAALTSLAAVRAAATKSGDTAAASLIERITDLASRRSALKGSDSMLLARPLRGPDSLDAIINQLQKRLVRLSNAFARTTLQTDAHWTAVRDRIGPNATAVEIALFPYFDAERQSDTMMYAAFALCAADTVAPRAAFLGTSAQIDDPALMREYYQALEPGRDRREGLSMAAGVLWNPIEDLCGNRKIVYLSPDGVYSQVSFASLPIDARTDVIDKYEVSILANTADLLRDTSGTAPRSVSIFADPAYTDRRLLASRSASTARARNSLSDLAQTRTEAKNLAAEFKAAQWNVRTFLGADASEENLDALRHQRVVHIATHATFRADTGATASISNDLLGCSLYLSGANTTLRSGSSDTRNDGVVSGLEAMYLDLEGTDLVTLSACESGRGVIEPGEGVFGLPRALRTAGARNVLMSLWRVPDRETAELMTLFYKKLLQGESKAAALRSAQLKMRATIRKRWGKDEPLYWAGFELIGF